MTLHLGAAALGLLACWPTRQWALGHCGLDFADFPALFESNYVVAQGSRHDYDESRYAIVGQLRGRLGVAAFVGAPWAVQNHQHAKGKRP